MSLCPNCRKEGPHYVCPSLGEPGYFTCTKFVPPPKLVTVDLDALVQELSRIGIRVNFAMTHESWNNGRWVDVNWVREVVEKTAVEPNLFAKLSAMAQDWRNQANLLGITPEAGREELGERDALNKCAEDLQTFVYANEPQRGAL